MSDFSRQVILPGNTIFSSSSCIGGELLLANGMPAASTSGAWPTANTALFMPMLVPRPFIFKQVGLFNGATVSGNVDMGIYDPAGIRLVSSGSVAQAGTNVTQTIDITDTPVNPGLYYLAIALNNGTGTTFRWTAVTNVWRAAGILAMASAFNLPATATYSASLPAPYMPIMYATGASVV